MTRKRLARGGWRRGAGLFACVLLACSGKDSATGLATTLLEGSDIVIVAIEPDTATVDTMVTVRLTGSGFPDGATATWLIDTTAVPEIRTISTTWKSPSELEALISISPDAPLRSYSVRIRGKKGKQGIAVEKFRVVAKPTALPEPGYSSGAVDINDNGVIVGSANIVSSEGTVAVRWTPVDTGWTWTILGPGGASAINNDGLIVRSNFDRLARTWRSWIHLPSGTVVDFGPVYVRDISDNGTLIGSTFDSLLRATGVTWQPLSATSWSTPQPLPLPPGFTSAEPLDINVAGDVSGAVYNDTSSASVVWRFRDGRWQSPTPVDTTIDSGAYAINDNGALAGWMLPCIPGLPNCYSSPAWWPSPGGQRTTLPTLYNTQAWAYGLNNANQVVGSAFVHYSDGVTVFASLVRHAVIWFPGSQWPEDLGAIRPSQAGDALAINNRGWVVGSMNNYTLDRHATLWKLPAMPSTAAARR